MEQHYKLRITLTECDKQAVMKFLSAFSAYSYVEELGKKEENPHFHIYLITNVKNDTLRTRLRKLTKSARGNKLYSLKELELDSELEYAIEYLAYMMKEGTVVYNGEWPEDVVAEATAYDKKVKEEIKEKKEKKKSKYKRIVEAFEKEFTNESGEMKQITHMDTVVEFVIDFHLQENGVFSQSMIENYSTTLMLKYNVYSYKSTFKKKILKRLNDM